jgi:uncharacterized protein YecE (DUF72 family)
MREPGRIRVGIGGWTYAPWRSRFYPEGLPHSHELAHAAGALPSIEVNGTFYRTQSPKTFAAWRDATPPGFVFALKAPRYATSRRVLAEAGETIARFVASGIAELGDRLGPINWQFAPTKAFEPGDFAAFLALLPEAAGGLPLRHAVEIRHPSFETEAFIDLARARRVAIVFAGDSEYPEIDEPTADFAYARIMGTVEGEPLGYAPAALDAWAARAKAWAADGRDVFLYAIGGYKAANPAAAAALIARLGRTFSPESPR